MLVILPKDLCDMTRRWRGPDKEFEDLVLGTPWTCWQCQREFSRAVASELGQRRCRHHPGQLVWSPPDLPRLSCCGGSDTSLGCSRCDHAPILIWKAAAAASATLIVPAYIIAPLTRHVRPVASRPNTPLYKQIERRARLELAFWDTLPSSITTPAIERAQAQVAVMTQWNAATEQRVIPHTFSPFVRPPEEEAAERQLRALDSLDGSEARLVELLVRPHSDARAWADPPSDDFSKLMANELRRAPMAWLVVSLADESPPASATQ